MGYDKTYWFIHGSAKWVILALQQQILKIENE